MGAGFWAGFGEQFSDTVEENRKYIRKAKDDRRSYLMEKGSRALASNKKEIQKMQEYVSYFTARGIPKRSVQGLLEKSGYAGIKNFYSMLNNRPELSSEELSEVIDQTASYASAIDIDPITIMKRAFNTVPAGEKDPVVRKSSFLQSLIGNEPNWKAGVDAEYPELTSAIANEGNVPTDEELEIAKRAARYTGDDFPTHPKYGDQTRARAYASTLEKLKSLSTDNFLTEYSEVDQNVLINAALREKQFPGQVTDNPNLIEFSRLLKRTIANAKVFASPEAYARSEFRNVAGYYMIAGNLKYNPGGR